MKRFVLALALLAPGVAQAGLLGTQAVVRYDFSTGGFPINTSDTVVIGPGIELSCPGAADICRVLTAPDSQTIDLGDTTIRYAFAGPASTFVLADLSSMIFEQLDAGAPILGVALATDLPDLDAGRISFTATSVTVDLNGVALPGPTSFFELSLVLAPVEVPAPAAFLPFAAGLLGLGLLRRRRGG
jgi:hypothetical protein